MFQRQTLQRKQKKALMELSLDTLQKANLVASSIAETAEAFLGLVKSLTPEDIQAFAKALGQATEEIKEGGKLHE